MQVVILCGGMGTRIRDVADDVPKPMIPIGGRPILWHILTHYAAPDRFTRSAHARVWASRASPSRSVG